MSRPCRGVRGFRRSGRGSGQQLQGRLDGDDEPNAGDAKTPEFVVVGDEEVDSMSSGAGEMNGIRRFSFCSLPYDGIGIGSSFVEGYESSCL